MTDDYSELIDKTVAQQRAKQETINRLLDEGLPVPDDLAQEFGLITDHGVTGAPYSGEEDEAPPTEEFISTGRYIEAIGFLSSVLADASGAWDGEAPEWFPEPPQWLQLAENALEATRPNLNDLVGEGDPQVWTERWLEIVHNNPSIPFDEGTMIGWFANAIESGAMEEQRRERERREHPLHYLDLDAPDPPEEFANVIVFEFDLDASDLDG